jgi:hypothetical protein
MRCTRAALFPNAPRLGRAAALAVALIPYFLLSPKLAASPILDAGSESSDATVAADPLLGATSPVRAADALTDAGRAAAGSRTEAAFEMPGSKPGTLARPIPPEGNASRREAISPDSLKSVFRSVTTMRRGPPHRGELAPSPQPTGADYFDPIELILESDAAGNALRALLEVRSTDGQFTIFSVFGMGDFVLELESSTRSAIFYELSSGWSAALINARNGGELLGYSADLTRASEYAPAPRENINIFRLAWNWIIETLTSPLGVFATMVVGIVLFTWAVARAITLLQRRTLGSRR